MVRLLLLLLLLQHQIGGGAALPLLLAAASVVVFCRSRCRRLSRFVPFLSALLQFSQMLLPLLLFVCFWPCRCCCFTCTYFWFQRARVPRVAGVCTCAYAMYANVCPFEQVCVTVLIHFLFGFSYLYCLPPRRTHCCRP